ncbi:MULTISPECIES: enoyl-ACP reductase FabI [unclassified Streptomyces]|uniref:enoyl-ACP reductase FabI n=1 Tax=unclassified Streptomyces TaxID=2593676 RepID=UPI0011E69EE9|nr:enoyl-ACP reductase FabI [Streptomyces sp. sk2.1]TXS59996.1 enoyl-[acyl-carrier-protein] reductase FabI [Streptomyces sp. sk2.1]
MSEHEENTTTAAPGAGAGLLAGKRLLVTGIITPSSIAYHVAEQAQLAGARVVATAYGRTSLVKRVCARLPEPVPVVELDVTDATDLERLAGRVSEHLDGLDGVVHSIAHGSPACFDEDFAAVPWPEAARALEVSAYSLASLTHACRDLLAPGASIVGLDFDGQRAWEGYNWMGVSKAALESVARYLAMQMGPRGVRVNLVAAGPLRTVAATSIPGFDATHWAKHSPLGWDDRDAAPVARTCCAVLSDWMPATSGSVVWADGGYHIAGP